MYNYKVKLDRVIDGDTIDVDIDLGFGVWLKKQRLRLFGINAPESRTRDLEEKARGLAAKAWLEKELQGDIRITTAKDSKGKFGRWLAVVHVKDAPQSINKTMIEQGHAVKAEY